MAFTYLILNVIFIAVAVIAFAKYLKAPNKPVVIMAIALLILTLIFDNLIIVAGIVGYDTSKLLGIYLGVAPIEDFFYTLLAALLIPALWNLFSPKHTEKDTHA